MNDRVNTDVKNVSQQTIDKLEAISQAKAGYVFLGTTSAFPNQDTGQCPKKNYTGFIVAEDAQISAIDYGNYAKLYEDDGVIDITSFTFLAGLYYPLQFKQLTLASGALILCKKEIIE